jgi:hypothetical protein
MPVYTRSQLKNSINSRIYNKVGLIADINTTINDAVREVISSVDLRSTKRSTPLAPNLFNSVYQYHCPTDLKASKIIDLQLRTQERDGFHDWELTTEDEFDRRKLQKNNLITTTERDLIRKILVSASVEDVGFVISPLDSLSSNGTWTPFGDGINLSIDYQHYIKGTASLKFDISNSGGTTAGINSINLPTFDLTDFKSDGSVFVWAWVTSTNDLINYTLRLGSSTSDYYSMSVTTSNDGLPFSHGWNLLRFDFSSKSTTGSPNYAACNYAAIYMTKTTNKINETGYRFNHIVVKQGSIPNLIYYSKYPWRNSSGVYLENSTHDDDYLNVDTDEYNIIIEKCVEWCANAVREDSTADRASIKYVDLVNLYRRTYRSERLPITNTYYNL